MSKVRVCFRYGDYRIASRLICFVRGGDAAHCEAAYHWDGVNHDCVSSSFADRGVRPKMIPMPASKWRIYEVPGDPRRILQWLAKNDHRGYGYLRLLRFLFAPARWRVGGPLCGQAVPEAIGWPDPWLYDPRTLEAACKMLVAIGVAVQIQ